MNTNDQKLSPKLQKYPANIIVPEKGKKKVKMLFPVKLLYDNSGKYSFFRLNLYHDLSSDSFQQKVTTLMFIVNLHWKIWTELSLEP